MKFLSAATLLLLALFPALPARGEVRGTGKTRGAPPLSELLEKFRKEESMPPARRISTAGWIARSKDPGAVDFLLARVPLEKAPLVQSVLARGLGTRVGDSRVLQALPSLWEKLAPLSRSSLVRALPSPLPGTALDFFRRVFLLESGGSPLLQAALVKPIAGSLGKEEAFLFLKETADRELSTRVRPFPALARALAEELARLGGGKAQEVFVALAASNPIGVEEVFRKEASKFQDPECLVWWVKKGLKSKDPRLRLLSLHGLGGSKDPLALQALRKALSDRDPRIQREAARALGMSGDPKGASSLERMLRKGPLVNRLEALGALHRLRRDDPSWVETLVKLARSHYPAFRARALDLLADLGDREVFSKVKAAAVERNWMVRSAFYSYVARIREPRAVPLLIERLGVETGRLRVEVEKALHRIAGITFGFDLSRWRYWWEKEKEGFQPPPLKKHVARKRRYGNTYYGIPVVSRRVIFILDVSGSMATKVDTAGRTRLDLAKEALVQALTRFTKETRFNIVFFHTQVRAWGRKLMPATRANQKKAVGFVRSTRPMGATNLYGALELAFQDKDADTIYLLSDGSPTAGEIVDPARIAREVLSWNLLRRMVIHTISLGTPSALLQKLAKESGGQYVRR